VYISEKAHFSEFSNKSALFWFEEELQYGDWLSGPSGDGSFSKSGQIEISEVRDWHLLLVYYSIVVIVNSGIGLIHIFSLL